MTFRSIREVVAPASNDLLKYVEDVAARAKARPRQAELPSPMMARQLPLWADEIRCMPNEILRSALFNARNRNQPRRYFKNESIAIIDQFARITFTGEELRQNDELVWLQLIHLAKGVPAGAPIEFTGYSMIKALRLTKGKPNAGHTERLLESLQRMQATALSIYSKRLAHGVSLSMIPRFEWQDESTGKRLPKWRVHIAPELVDLFGSVHFTCLLWEQRLALPSGLATWLHGYYASHRKPYAVNLSTLQEGCGCSTKSPRKFKQLTAAALLELERVGFLKKGSEIRGELVYVARTRQT
ncbi:MAG TPA: hypothetical protein DCW29_16560, partial [Janthinobacterium sp.]|nr:hypothetical protein [Janthinobacterium sp.]